MGIIFIGNYRKNIKYWGETMKKIVVTNKKELKARHKSENTGYEYLKYIPIEEGINNQCTVMFYDIPPKKYNYPYHYHGSDVEIFYIIAGKGKVETEEGIKNISSGDLIICPPGKLAAHKITNISETENLSHIEFDTIHKPEVIKYPHSKKIGIINIEGDNRFFREKDNKEYYDGE